MNVTREEIYAALYAKLAALSPATILTVSRRLRHIEDVQPAEFPACYQVQQNESPMARPKLPTVWTLNAEWWLYVREPDTSAAPSTRMNPLMDAITVLLDPEMPLVLQTLGGRVFHASISGTVEVIEGVLDDRAMAIFPIRIVKAD